MFAADLQGNVRIVRAAHGDIKARQPVCPHEIVRVALRGRVAETEPEDGLRDACKRLAGALVVPVGNDVTADGNKLGKTAERMLDIGEVFEKVEMVGFHVEDDRKRGEEAQK